MSEETKPYGVTVMCEPPEKNDRFEELARQLTVTHRKKNRDYGNSFSRSVRKYGLIAALVRISDKFNRAENLILNRGKQYVRDESLTDTLLDLAAYCIMTTIEIENASKVQETPPRRGDTV